jgi:hypothetical protein
LGRKVRVGIIPWHKNWVDVDVYLDPAAFSCLFSFFVGEIEGEERGLLGFVLLYIVGRMETGGKMLQVGDSTVIYSESSY